MLRAPLMACATLICLTAAQAQESNSPAVNGEVTLAYWTYGPDTGTPVIVINGQGAATRLGDPFAAALVARGFRVILFDNRDSGQSTILSEAGPPPGIDQANALTEADAPAAYDLSDMAKDTIAVLDAAGIDRAHVLGHSLGGMVAQVVAADHPDRVLSLISVSSTSGDPGLPFGPAMAELSEPSTDTQEDPVEQLSRIYRIFDGTGYTLGETELLERVTADMAVDDPYAAHRQGAAVMATGDRRSLLRQIALPALVIHGSHDPWFPTVHAASTAEALGGAPVEIIDGLGHILTDAAAAPVAARVAGFVARLPTR